MKRIILLAALICSISLSAQRIYSIDGVAKRFSTALGIPVKAASFYNTSSDTAIIFFDPSDTSTIFFKYKGISKKISSSTIAWDSIAGKPTNFSTTYALSNDVRDSIQTKLALRDTSGMLSPYARTSNLPSLTPYKLISDTLFNNGYTTRVRLKQAIDSLAAATVSGVSSFNSRTGAVTPLVGDYSSFYKGVADSFFVTGFTTRGRTKQIIDSLGAAKQNVLTNPITGTGTSGQLAYFTGTSTQTGSSNLTWDNTNKYFTLGNASGTNPFGYWNGSQERTGLTTLGSQYWYQNDGTQEIGGISFSTPGGFPAIATFKLGLRNRFDMGVNAEAYTGFGYDSLIATPSLTFFRAGRRMAFNTTTDNGVDLVQVNGSLIATTLKGTTATISGAATVGSTLAVTGNGSFGSYLGLNNRTTPIYSEQLTVGIFSVPKITLAQSGGYRWSTYVDATDAKYRIRYEDGSIDPLIIDRSGGVSIGGTLGVTGAITASNLAGTGTRAVEASSTGVLSATKILDAGTYTPTLTNGTNVTSSSNGGTAYYTRIGNTVTVTGLITIQSTATNAYSIVYLSLPIASDVPSGISIRGLANTIENTQTNQGVFKGDTVNDRAYIEFYANTTASGPSFTYTFTYIIQ